MFFCTFYWFDYQDKIVSIVLDGLNSGNKMSEVGIFLTDSVLLRKSSLFILKKLYFSPTWQSEHCL